MSRCRFCRRARSSASRRISAISAEGAVATFDVAVVDPTGKRVARQNVHWSLYRVTNDYQWYNSDGRWNFEQVKSSKRIADGAFDVTAADAAKIAQAVEWGNYRLDLRTADGSGLPTSISFEVGWSGDATAQTPDLLQVTLDKTDYKPGDAMQLAINSRFDGKATVAMSGDKIDDQRHARREDRRQRDRHSGRRRLGRRCLCHRHRSPAARCSRQAHAGPRFGIGLVQHRCGCTQARRDDRCAGENRAAPTCDFADPARRAHARRGSRSDGRRRRCRHSQSHQLSNARSDVLFLRTAAIGARDPRSLWTLDRRHAGNARCHPHRR